MITHFTIFGERCSGTNYLEQILLLNFNIEVTWEYEWKHFPQKETDYSNSENTLFICISRNILDWLNSFYKNMHHLPLRYNTDDLTESEKINKFLNEEFWSCDDRYGKPEIIKELMIDGKYLDRNIYTGERYKNIFEMRSTKLHYLFRDLGKKVKNFMFIRHEDLIYNFKNTLIKMRDRGLEVKNKDNFPENMNQYMNSGGICDIIFKNDKRRHIREDMVFENKNFLKYDEYEELLYKGMNTDKSKLRVALQIFGEFRTSEKCLLDILEYIDYNNDKYTFDVFILTQQEGKNYSKENLEKLETLLGKDNIKVLKCIEEYSDVVKMTENKLVEEYYKAAEEVEKKTGIKETTNKFVTRLWFRQKLLNDIRKDYEKKTGTKYDYVVRTRLDLEYKNEKTKEICAYIDPLYIYPDAMTIAKPEIVNIELDLTLHFPYSYKIKESDFTKNNGLDNFLINKSGKWAFMSEGNLILYLYHKLDKVYHKYLLCKNQIRVFKIVTLAEQITPEACKIVTLVEKIKPEAGKIVTLAEKIKPEVGKIVEPIKPELGKTVTLSEKIKPEVGKIVEPIKQKK